MDCPYCSDRLTRHIQQQQVYWFCRSCWQRIPDLELDRVDLSSTLCDNPTTIRLQKTHPSGACRQLKERIASVAEVTAQTA